MRSVFIVSLFALINLAICWDDEFKLEWINFKKEHLKVYENHEEFARLYILTIILKFI